MEYNYNKKSIWKWILLYFLIGAFAYGLIYYFFFYKKGDYAYNEYNQEKSQNQLENYEGSEQSISTLINTSADLKVYTSDNNYFSVLWPRDWKIQTYAMGIVLSGKEGSINIAWNGLGGACDTEYKNFTIGEDEYSICGLDKNNLYIHSFIVKTSNKDIAIGVIPVFGGYNDSERSKLLMVLQSIKLKSIKEIVK